ncbi:MAG TPA: toprim domain-containing protein [Candidatus Paceibacterota bacterium]|nr:toprim domain-containing protein [Candidatus Paceibacterota bacterium]
MDSLHRLEELFAHFPGIGPRQARRFVYYLLGRSPASIAEFIKLIEEVRKATSECPQCHRLYINSTKQVVCSVCADPSRDASTLMIVARDSDFESIEKSGTYKGLYFILGGTVPILDKEPEKRIRVRGLLERIEKQPAKEIILSLNTTPDGEHTANIVRDALKNITATNPALSSTKVTILGRGLSTGAELEYADSETIRNALQNRR